MKRNNELVPFEKSKRIIYLEKRGREKGRVSVGSVVFGFIGVLCILYCIAIGFAGFGTRFFLIWGAIGIACVLLSAVLAHEKLVESLPGWLKGIAIGIFCQIGRAHV